MTRFPGPEMMDNVASPELLRQALLELPKINRGLGGYRATMKALVPFVEAKKPKSLRILDVGTGIGDYPVEFVRLGLRRGIDIRVVAVDLSDVTIDIARRHASTLPAKVSSRITFEVADSRQLPFAGSSFDIATAAMFFHHLDDDGLVRTLRQMARVARDGVIVNDLHRHPLAYYGIRALAGGLRFSTMVKHDGPVSVRRAFRRSEFEQLAQAADLNDVSIHWRWAFRWVLTNLPTS